MLQTLKLNNKKRKKSSFYEEKSLVRLTPVYRFSLHFQVVMTGYCWRSIFDDVTLLPFTAVFFSLSLTRNLMMTFLNKCCEPSRIGQFHQHFMSAFAPIFLRQKKSSNLKCSYKKVARKILVKLTPGCMLSRKVILLTVN
jgi:hypothetical protein